MEDTARDDVRRATDASTGSADDVVERDPTLSDLLRAYCAPPPSDELDERILRAYRRQVVKEPFWRRFFSSSVRVPLPLLLSAVLLLIVSAVLVLRRASDDPGLRPSYATGSGAPAVARIERPVVTQTNLAGFEPLDEVNVTVFEQRYVR
jgi:hypothetical protein